jgi:hypothetical protein
MIPDSSIQSNENVLPTLSTLLKRQQPVKRFSHIHEHAQGRKQHFSQGNTEHLLEMLFENGSESISNNVYNGCKASRMMSIDSTNSRESSVDSLLDLAHAAILLQCPSENSFKIDSRHSRLLKVQYGQSVKRQSIAPQISSGTEHPWSNMPTGFISNNANLMESDKKNSSSSTISDIFSTPDCEKTDSLDAVSTALVQEYSKRNQKKRRVHMCGANNCYRIFPSQSRLKRHERSHQTDPSKSTSSSI